MKIYEGKLTKIENILKRKNIRRNNWNFKDTNKDYKKNRKPSKIKTRIADD